VRFSHSAATGASNPDGLVYGTKDIYVFDSSGFPSSSSSHTMTPIMTIAHYLAAKLANRN
jgi:choline dehydrogenase-like flavoprotein